VLRLALCVTAIVLVGAGSASGAGRRELFTHQVTDICAGARLFDGQHQIGTRAGAVAVSRDILRTGTRRLWRVGGLPEPASEVAAIRAWLATERLLVDAYARDYLLIWDAIEVANTPAQLAALPAEVDALVHQPDRLKRRADALEQRIDVPDCTGGGH
jgi:hypothetical protein